MRIASIAAALFVLLALTAAAAPARVQDSRAKIIKAAKTDLAAALVDEQHALAEYQAGDENKARNDIARSHSALQYLARAVNLLLPDPWEAHAYMRVHGTEEPWHHLADQVHEVFLDDHAILDGRGSFLPNVKRAIAEKKEMLAFVDGASRDRCTVATNLEQLSVNGVPQGPSTLGVAVSCSEPMEEVDLDLKGITWTDEGASPGTVRIVDGGDVLEVDLGGAKYMSVTAEGNPDFAPGDKVEGDIIPIHGDSAAPIDETM